MLKDPLKNIEAEMSVIGASLLDPTETMQKAHTVTASDFTNQRHRCIWQAILNLHQKNAPIDLVSLSSELKKHGYLEKAGGSTYLATLVDYVPTAANIGYYIKLINECTGRRNLAGIGRKITGEAIEAKTLELAQDKSESLLMGFRVNIKSVNKPSSLGELVTPALKNLEELNQNEGIINGIPTGYPGLDKMIYGFQPGDLILIGGRPSMGKTAFALNITDNATRKGHKALFFTLEMSKEQLVNRLLCSLAGIDAGKFRTGNLKDEDWPKLTEAAACLNHKNLFIDETPAIQINELKTKARRVKAEHGLSLVVVDYLQLMRGNSTENRQQEISEISRALKSLAKELNVPVVALSQLNRSLESRSNKRPIMADLRESGAIEQDADLIMFAYRESVYCDQCKQLGRECEKHYRKAEIIIGKQRNGPIGTVFLRFQGEYTRFI